MNDTFIHAVLVDDEEPARLIVREYLASHPDIRIVAECCNGFEAVKAVNDLKPDILFLDIQMPKLNGFEVLELIQNECAVVFTTAYDEFALQAFEVHAVDYLLKPFSQDRFDESLRIVRERIGTNISFDDNPLSQAMKRHDIPLERILIRDGSKVIIIPTETIIFAEALDDYVSIVTEERKHLKQMTLSSLEEQLDPSQFVRIHRSHILNITFIAKIELYAKDSRVAILKNGERLNISRSGYARLKELL